MCELVRAVADLEAQLQAGAGLSLNEAMVLCCIAHDNITATRISENVGLAPSNTSKVLRSVENKGLVVRTLGETDRRQMSFSLSASGLELLQKLKSQEWSVPDFIRPLFLQ